MLKFVFNSKKKTKCFDQYFQPVDQTHNYFLEAVAKFNKSNQSFQYDIAEIKFGMKCLKKLKVVI